MGIDIVNQTNNQECGVCVLTSLHNYYYKNKVIDKQKVLDQANISDNGMSIFDFEVCANKLELECESYEVKWSEFINLKINSYFVLLLASSDAKTNHYVIAKKRKQYIEIYDSINGQVIKHKYTDIKNSFLNVIMLVSKKPNKTFNTVFGKTKTLLMLDFKFVLLNIFLSLFILLTSIATASFLNWVIDLAIGKQSVNNLIILSFIFVVVYFSNDLLTYLSTLYCANHLKSYYLLFTNKILASLEKKKFGFLNKVDTNWIYKIDECVYSISNFCVIEVNKFISNVIFCTICVCIIGIVQYYLLIFVAVILIIELIFYLFSYRKKKEVFINVVRHENKNVNFYKQLIDSLNNQQWFSKRTRLVDSIKNNYSSIYKNFNDVTIFKSNIDLFKSLLKSLVEICLIATMGYLIIKNNKITLGNVTFVLSAVALYRNSLNEIFNYSLSKIEFDIYWQVYKDITEVDNLKNQKQLNIDDEIKTISFEINGNKIEFSTAKDHLLKTSILELLTKSEAIYVNGIKEDKDNVNILKNIIICDEYSKFDIEYFQQQFEQHPEIYAPFIRYFKINLNSQMQSFYKTLILNLLSLLNEEKKIIFLDSILDFIPQKDQFVAKDIVNKIKKQNYVFVTRKEEYD